MKRSLLFIVGLVLSFSVGLYSHNVILGVIILFVCLKLLNTKNYLYTYYLITISLVFLLIRVLFEFNSLEIIVFSNKWDPIIIICSICILLLLLTNRRHMLSRVKRLKNDYPNAFNIIYASCNVNRIDNWSFKKMNHILQYTCSKLKAIEEQYNLIYYNREKNRQLAQNRSFNNTLLGKLLSDNLYSMEDDKFLTKESKRLIQALSIIRSYPFGVDYLIPKILGYPFTFTNTTSLSKEKVDIILDYENDIMLHDKRIIKANEILKANEIKKEQDRVHEIFDREVLKNSRRSLYYKDYGLYIGDNSEKACVDNLNNLDVFIRNFVENKYNMLKASYPAGLEYFNKKRGFRIEDFPYWEICIRNINKIKEYDREIKDYEEKIRKLNEIHKKYPNAFKEINSINKMYFDNNGRHLELIIDEVLYLGEKKLEELEHKSSQLIRFRKWNNEQDSFAQFCYDMHDQYFPKWKCYLNEIDIDNLYLKEISFSFKYKIWQHFLKPYCKEPDLDYSNCVYYKDNFINLQKCITKRAHFINDIYDNVYNFIFELNTKYDKCLVLFGDSNDSNSKSLNDDHFSYLRLRLVNSNFDICDDITEIRKYYWYKHVVIVELITTNNKLKSQIKQMLSEFNNDGLNISYVSLFKGYERYEMESIIREANHKAESEKIIAEKLEKDRLQSINEEFQRANKKQLEKERIQKIKEKRANEEKQKRERLLKEFESLKKCVTSWYIPYYTSLKCFSMYNYYPTKCEWDANNEEWGIRNLIWNFKASPTKPMPEDHIKYLHKIAADKVMDKMSICLNIFFNDDVSKLTLVCIPSSTQSVNNIRYRDFSTMICDKLNMTNGYQHIRVSEDGDAKHIGGIKKAQLEIDDDFFREKFVLLFDDVITSGKSIENIKLKMEKAGAFVIGGFSIGKTMHKRQGVNPIDEIERYKIS